MGKQINSVSLELNPPTPTTDPEAIFLSSPLYSLTNLLLTHGADPNAQDQVSGSTLLHLLARYGIGLAAASWLVKSKGSNLELPDMDGNTPLHVALEYQNYLFAQHLIRLGSNPNAKGRGGATSLLLILKTILEIRGGHMAGGATVMPGQLRSGQSSQVISSQVTSQSSLRLMRILLCLSVLASPCPYL